MARVVFHLDLSPFADQGLRYAVKLWRLVDDGRDHRREAVLPSVEETAELAIDESWLAAMQQARTAPASGPSTTKVNQLGVALWHALPEFVRHALELPLAADEVIRVVLCATGRVLELPWECLACGDWSSAEQSKVFRAVFLRGQGELVRRPRDVERVTRELAVSRRALLIFGSLAQEPQASHAGEDALAIARAIGRGGFEVEIAAGRREVDGAHAPSVIVQHPIDSKDDLLRQIRQGKYSLIHYVGHSGATSGADPMGASLLRLENDGFEVELSLAELAAACKDGGVRCAVFSSCDLRTHAADELLRHGALEHVLTMGAMVPAEVCSQWSKGFYESLRDHHSVSLAARAGTLALKQSHPSLSWLPQHHERDDVDLSFIDDERVLIERYCNALCARLDAFEGRFRKRLDPATLADVYVELTIDERAADRKDPNLDERDKSLPKDCTFARLTGLHTLRFLIGGKPGAGKSTTLRVHARALASDSLRARVPVFVTLAEWLPPEQKGGYARLCDFVAGRDTPSQGEKDSLADALARLGRDGELLVLLDGLDELSAPARAFLVEELARLAQLQGGHAEWGKSRFVVSSRRYEHTVRIRGFADVDIQELTPQRAAELLANVLRTQKPQRDDACRNALTWQRNFECGPRAWRELGKVPLFVTLIGELLIYGRKVQASRIEFFEEVFAHLCLDQHHGPEVDPERAGQGPRALVAGELEEEVRLERLSAVLVVLGALALRMTEESRLTASRSELLAWLRDGGEEIKAKIRASGVAEGASKFLDEVARKTLILAPDTTRELGKHEQSNAPWRFWHRSFQEALTGRAVAAAVRSEADVPATLARMRIEPSSSEIAAERERLLAKWRKDQESFWDDFREAQVASSAEQWQTISAHLDWQTRRLRPSVFGPVAEVLAPITARRAQHEFWIEPAAVAMATLLRRSSSLSERFAAGLIEFDRDLGRSVVEKLDRCPPAIFGRALDATSRTDAQVAAADGGDELYEGLTRRLSERVPLYVAAASNSSDSEGLVRLLLQRVESIDDPGELFLVDELFRVLGAEGKPAREAVMARCGTFDASAFTDHFACVEGAEFEMGSATGQDRERPVHRVTVSPFAIGRTPITVAMYRCFWPQHRMEIGSGVHRLDGWQGSVSGSEEEVDRLPVTYVSYWAARMFCRWLDRHLARLPGHQSGWRVALPREAEAEFAIRGGARRGDGEWSCAEGDLSEHAWFHPDAGGRPHAVGMKRPNPLGLNDVHGNLWEWCEDVYAPYPTDGASVVDPVVLGPSASSRVLRGGSFVSGAGNCRSACRVRLHPAGSSRDYGFRVVLAVRSPGSEWSIDDR